MKSNLYNTKIFILIVALISILNYSCENKTDEISTNTNIQWKENSIVEKDKGVSSIIIQGMANTKWTASITEGEEWCSFSLSDNISTKEGTLTEGTNTIYVYYSGNSNDKSRKACISIIVENEESKLLELTQRGQTYEPDLDENDGDGSNNGENTQKNAWAEIPEYKNNANFEYVTHYVTVDGKKIRNYSMCYDKSHKAALWVAYPLHKCYQGNIDRTDNWTYDPEIEQKYQIYVNKAYKEHPKYDRGHQIPSADRTKTREMNEQTFYFTNQTPQTGPGFNQSIWVNLEEKIRKSYMCTDTLYVVTGAYFANSNTKATDNNGTKVDVPTHYFKILLRSKSGMSGKWVNDCNASELQSIGFWFENRVYSDSQITKAVCKSVSEIERLTGFTFFPNIPEEVKEDFNTIDWYLN